MDHWAAMLPPGWTIAKLYGGQPSSAPADGKGIVRLLNEGVSLVVHAGHGNDNGWAGSFNVEALAHVQNNEKLPVVISVGCSTARFATLPPYEAYEDVRGNTHRGTNSGEVFHAPPPAPRPTPGAVTTRPVSASRWSAAGPRAPWLTSAATPAANLAP